MCSERAVGAGVAGDGVGGLGVGGDDVGGDGVAGEAVGGDDVGGALVLSCHQRNCTSTDASPPEHTYVNNFLGFQSRMSNVQDFRTRSLSPSSSPAL